MKAVSVTEVPSGAQLIDVRETDEYNAGHAQNARNIPMSEFTEHLSEIDRTQEVYVICLSGGRSAKVCEFLESNGISCTNVEGGTRAWEESDLPMA